MSTFGKSIEVSLFGESHGDSIGITIHNLPSGILLDLDEIANELLKRRPKSKLSTPRQEKDTFKFLSGLFNGRTTGSPLTVVIENKDTKSKDYSQAVLRPSHADFTSHIKYNSYNDYRGSGHFSGRITAPLMILGAISKQLLKTKNISVISHISSIKDKYDDSFPQLSISDEIVKKLICSDFPVINDEIKSVFEEVILNAKNNNDSVGGTIETAIINLSPGLGEPFFDSMESIISHLIFSIPAVKGIEFGKGFDITQLFGSEANDSFIMDNGSIKTKTNNSGGIQGGITNGMPIIFKTAIKPTASIGKPQQTVNIETLEEVTLELVGRHDPSIVHRVVHVINAITNYAVLEMITRKEGFNWIK
ncbi:MAG: chorismate synthase [Candidatus Izemoplasma sp.]